MRLSNNSTSLRYKVSQAILSTLLVAGISVICPHGSKAADWQSKSKLEARIRELISASGAETVGVAFYDLGDGSQLMIDAEKEFHAASTMKVPVMMEVFKQAREGKFTIDDTITVKNDFVSIVDGSRYSITAESDSDTLLYKKIGQTETIRNLVHLMITVSSNLATNILIERVGAKNVMKLMRSIGAKKIQVLRGVEDSKAFERGMNNTTTARDLMIVLRHIAERRSVSPESSDEMIKIMLDQKFNEGIPAGLPADVKVAHKTGSITKVNHDAAIIYPPGRKPCVLVVLTRGIEDEKRAHKLIADISHTIYGSLASGQ
jgi:beta-lactamase class A